MWVLILISPGDEAHRRRNGDTTLGWSGSLDDLCKESDDNLLLLPILTLIIPCLLLSNGTGGEWYACRYRMTKTTQGLDGLVVNGQGCMEGLAICNAQLLLMFCKLLWVETNMF